MLHILRHSPYSDTRLASCLRAVSSGQSLLLIEEAVYSLLPGTATRDALEQLPSNISLYVLENDLLARGLTLEVVASRVQTTDYLGMVELCANHAKVVSW